MNNQKIQPLINSSSFMISAADLMATLEHMPKNTKVLIMIPDQIPDHEDPSRVRLPLTTKQITIEETMVLPELESKMHIRYQDDQPYYVTWADYLPATGITPLICADDDGKTQHLLVLNCSK